MAALASNSRDRPPNTGLSYNVKVTDEELLIQHVRGGTFAFAELHARYVPILLPFLLSRTGGRVELAEEALQETWLRVHRFSGRFDPAQSFRAWLFVIACNQARNTLKLEARHTRLSLDVPVSSDDPDDPGRTHRDMLAAPENEEDLDDEFLQALLSEFSSEQLEVLQLVVMGLTMQQMAVALKVPVSTVKARIRAARERAWRFTS